MGQPRLTLVGPRWRVARRRRLGALTTVALFVYFLVAIGAHARVRDEAWRYVPAVGMLGWSWHARRAFRPDV